MADDEENDNVPHYDEGKITILWDLDTCALGISVKDPRSPNGPSLVMCHTPFFPFEYIASHLEKIAIDLRVMAEKRRREIATKAPVYRWAEGDKDTILH